jgi:hypothetical protein
MSDPAASPSTDGPLSREEYQSALFSAMVWQQSQMTMALLGQATHPESQKVEVDLQGARVLIDQLEMLESKTRGNLSAEESELLRQNLTSLRLLFVRTLERQEAPPPPQASAPAPATVAGSESAASASDEPAPGSAPEHRARFSKKY